MDSCCPKSIGDQEDAQLVREVYERYHQTVYGIALQKTTYRYDAEDIAVLFWETLARQFKAVKRFLLQSDTAFEAWLTRTVDECANFHSLVRRALLDVAYEDYQRVMAEADAAEPNK